MALGQGAPLEARRDWRFWALTMGCSVLPDFDVIGFGFGIRYGDLWGHRGMTHSILFAAVLGILAGALLGRSRTEKIWSSLLFFLITASHGALDGLTNGGLSIAFFSPFDTTRYFFPWRPIQVSPIGARWFFSNLGLRILLNEALFVWLPAALIGVALYVWRKWQREVRQTKDKT